MKVQLLITLLLTLLTTLTAALPALRDYTVEITYPPDVGDANPADADRPYYVNCRSGDSADDCVAHHGARCSARGEFFASSSADDGRGCTSRQCSCRS
ncbi:uncharacterized protein L3040_002003 [Drepanopeziza brunnea f. sp. 'multigermtubi']|uniref:Uncharacterized protein n=1 Tax=Marssonina brunnea f. sp. multigermtubi (strain MB_m1) TaxID=1072389 RepID=K1XFV1_MARBU|nr:uncharacterized protein MBM_01605 [Drepanopeziza brunnea f. sp. 'multigermtubi' MB_m1]EKD19653.1 hypothetical protein MBM_01605 [Drepanopeziza brunnea f. sp. 'multigermtubi' MB_m1]KAJ5052249.1 hypothetical protein L3040_002003 [Drepanopeziza brunnea f. sp. 'multigermtubi']